MEKPATLARGDERTNYRRTTGAMLGHCRFQIG
jgi:hypothetical protein